jgi:hypothetical protein
MTTTTDPDLPRLRRKAQAGVRRKPMFWNDDGSGWHHELGYADEWEVICPCTGDAGGPDYMQSNDVRRFRGPYDSVEAARAAAHQHNVEHHWI